MNSALLKFQIGPVQDFIAQARSTRDLWSGSYLLSWLVAAGLNSLLQKGAEAGLNESELNDCVVFPRLQSQPLLQKRQPGWFPPPNSGLQNDELLTPNLTNLFLAQLPLDTNQVTDIARTVEKAIRDEWKEIAGKCWNFSSDLLAGADRERFDRQVAGLLQIAWQVTPLVEGATAQHTLKSLPLSEAMQKTVAAASGSDLTFPATLALNAWQLDAVRQVRNFPGSRDPSHRPGKHNEKDSLTGREEQIVGGREWWERCVKEKSLVVERKDGKTPLRVDWPVLFRKRQAGEHFGAITFVKRLWHLAYLDLEHDLEAGHRAEPRGKHFPFPSTLHIASHDPAKNEDNPREGTPDEAGDFEKYFAVLTLDADEMGRWMSGEKFAPPVTAPGLRDFSDRLSMFGLRCARPIVEACDGRLIYSGGDDVLALLPADTALSCAQFLRLAFRGDDSFIAPMKTLAAQMLARHEVKARKSGLNLGQARGDYYVSPFLQAAAIEQLFKRASTQGELIFCGDNKSLKLPGQAADVSAGIAIAHFKSPLQDVVRTAQAAEKRAKRELGRSAVAVTLLKRSGEITEWGCKWEQHGLKAFFAMLDALQTGVVSGKFPHRIIELVECYQTDEPDELGGTKPADGFDQVVTEVLKSEIGTAAERQKGQNYSQPKVGNVQQAIGNYLDSILEASHKVRALIGLCQTVAFAHRTADDTASPVASVPTVPSPAPAESQPA